MPPALLDADPRGSASAAHMAAQLIAPLAAGARESVVDVAADGRVTVDRPTRETLVVVRLARSLDVTAWHVHATLPGATGPVPVAEFAPWSEAGATLPIYRPPTSPSGAVAPFALALALTEVPRVGVPSPVPASEVAARLTVLVVEGVLGRLLHVLGAEKARIRRAARELAAMRALDGARDHALDSHGADLAVPRLDHRLAFDPEAGILALVPERESDADYRRRLRIYRPFLQPSRRALLDRLNGPGAPTDPNRGLPGGTGVQARFAVREAPSDVAAAVALLATDDAVRTRFLDYVRAVHLVEPTAPVPVERFVPADVRANETALRARLAAGFAWPANGAVARALATALDQVARCRLALGETAPWTVARAQDAGGGSRFELGIGAELAAPSAEELDRMATRLRDAGPIAGTGAEIAALVRGLDPRPAADDPEGRWLLAGCGLRTVHRLAGGTLYVSHLPTGGMVIAAASPGGTAPVALEVRHHAPGDPGSNAVLVEGLAAARAAWVDTGREPWTDVAPADALAAWAAAVPVAVGSPAESALRSAGLPPVRDPANTARELGALPGELVHTVALPDALAGGIVADAAGASNELVLLLQTLREAGLSSALALVTAAGGVLLAVGVMGLPLAGVNLGARRATGFRWYAVRLAPPSGPPGRLTPVGSRARFAPAGPGLVAVVALGFARRGGTDPYEARIELPPGAVLDLPQYEYLMNLLDHLHPAGVEINTFPIRTGHVDLDGDGVADPLPPRFANHFREFRRPRSAGDAGPPGP